MDDWVFEDKAVHMSALEYLQIKGRLTKYKDDSCSIDCIECPICIINNGKRLPCDVFEMRFPEEAVEFVYKWQLEKEQRESKKTMLQDFKEKYPNAFLKTDGSPIVCPSWLGYEEASVCDCPKEIGCFACWNRPLQTMKEFEEPVMDRKIDKSIGSLLQKEAVKADVVSEKFNWSFWGKKFFGRK